MFLLWLMLLLLLVALSLGRLKAVPKLVLFMLLMLLLSRLPRLVFTGVARPLLLLLLRFHSFMFSLLLWCCSSWSLLASPAKLWLFRW